MNLQKLRLMSLPHFAYYEDDPDKQAAAAAKAAADAAEALKAKEAAAAKEKEEAERKAKEDEEKRKGSSLSDTEAKLLKEVMDKKDAIKALQEKVKSFEDGSKAEKEAAEKLKKQIEELGDLESLKKLLQEKKDKEKADLEAKGEWDRLKKQMAEEHAKAKEDLEKQLADRKSSEGKLQTQIHELTVGRSFSDSSYIRENAVNSPAIVRNLFQTHFDVVDGKVVGFDKPRGEDKRTQLVGSDGNPLPFDSAIEKIIAAHEDHKTLLKPKGKQGSGSRTSKDNPGADDDKGLTGAEKIAAALKARKAAK